MKEFTLGKKECRDCLFVSPLVFSFLRPKQVQISFR